jgi:SAGA-associated factor 29
MRSVSSSKFPTNPTLTFTEPSPSEIHQLDQLYRANVKNTDEEKEILNDDLMAKLQILKGLVSHNEQEASARGSNSRDSHSRSAMDLDGSVDSPGPSPAENKHVRKLGTGRPSSQPPRDKEKDTSEPSEPSNNPSRTKITFALGAEVAFKPKIQNQTEEHDWIQGIVVKVIGEGKSRRYDVQDPFPDDPTKPGVVYRSSASSMVPIPPTGSPLGPYEVGKQVLALYPETTTFYRAEVKSMQENGSKVQLLFEDDAQGALRIVDRRFVLDHKG